MARHDPLEVDLLTRHSPPVWQEGGSWSHPLGTDRLGRDVGSRLLYGARVSLLIAVPAVTISVTLGTFLGLWSGYVGGSRDRIMMRLVDFQMSIPALLVAILVTAFIGTGIWTIVLFLGFWGWTGYTRLVRGQVLSIRENVYVEAAIAIWAKPLRIMMLHILPNLIASVIVLVTFFLPTIIIIESSLSYLGLGVQPPAASWGNMLADGRTLMTISPWLTYAPAGVILLTVLACNFLGDRLRDIWDPRLGGSL